MIITRTIVSCHLIRPTANVIRSSLPSVTTTSMSFFSTNLNENNMSDIHEHHPQPPQQWATFHGKIPVLQTDTNIASDITTESATTSHHRPMPNPTTNQNFYGESPRVSLLMELKDRVGILHEVLKYFWKYDLNVSRIESRPVQRHKNPWRHEKDDQAVFDFYLDFDGTLNDPAAKKLLRDLAPLTEKLLVLDEKDVHWFPRHVSELDLIAHRTLDAGVDLESDHPGFNDSEYRARRGELARNAIQHRWDQPIPKIDYTKEEIQTWSAVWDRMEPLWKEYACKEYLHSLQLFKEHCGYSRNNIPQQQDISAFLKERTNFEMRPVAGLLSSRDFLNGLAFRVFFSTQYIRHHSQPLYTPEPDICHELLGHAPMFADRDFADFSQEIGLASLGASDEDVQKLAHCYWFSVEFGLCREGGKNKAYGAGLLSSFGELEYACSPEHPGAENPPEIKDWDPEVAASQEFPITTYQPTYFLASSLGDAKLRMREYCERLQRPFFALHNAQTNSVFIDRPVRRTKGAP
ncbi:tyrosine 3-monooxygenase [Nitzschia inconspicua]|uniref:phenylalanine 4-monooxygenase n=1 Tax=Nitzschia inconspicua TaxID=303405 RepID=A0A9K3PF79_9STRA|nr:tyrosine 3-monooxygenase [Nitzschia inconspicua]